ncbi:MAG: hypothetical protein ACP6IU_11895 [Candidatus Asgardarchaeia archaeon]
MKMKYCCVYCKSELTVASLERDIGVMYCQNCLRFYPIGNHIPAVPEILPDYFRDFDE